VRGKLGIPIARVVITLLFAQRFEGLQSFLLLRGEVTQMTPGKAINFGCTLDSMGRAGSGQARHGSGWYTAGGRGKGAREGVAVVLLTLSMSDAVNF
jgi:hypothetical protein